MNIGVAKNGSRRSAAPSGEYLELLRNEERRGGSRPGYEEGRQVADGEIAEAEQAQGHHRLADPCSSKSPRVLEGVFRDQWGRVLATLVGLLGDIELAEDAAQEAFALAAESWPRSGQPENPEVDPPAAALAVLDELALDNYQYFHSTRADLLRRLGRNDEARAAYSRALQLVQAGPERRFLESRLRELDARRADAAVDP